jgi:hypothetical protein
VGSIAARWAFAPACCKGRQVTARYAYADPPYLCATHLYKHLHPDWHVYAEIEGHAALVRRLCDEYPDGWALSMGSVDLPRLAPVLPDGVRLAAWCKSFASFKPGINPAYAWEPVAFMTTRKRDRIEVTARDFLVCPITVEKGLTGAKPEPFCSWVLDLMGWQPGDEVDDLFPGTGVMGRVVAKRQSVSMPLQLHIQEPNA